MKVSIIAAMDEKRGIGKDNKIPWHIKEDLVHLKGLTAGKIVILGRKSYESMDWYYKKSGNPMPGKLYVVITRDKDYKPARDNASVAHSLDEAISLARSHLAKLDEVFVIGGQSIFEQTISLADKLYLTIVDGNYNCDAFFPDYSEFGKVISQQEEQNEKYKFKFINIGR